MTGERCNVLISSAGRRVALLRSFRWALAALGVEGRVMAADASPLSAAYHEADAGFGVPPCTSEDFVPALLELCRSHEVRLVVPTIDTELGVYAAHRPDFEEAGTTVAVSSPAVVEISADKVRTHQWLESNGFPTVRQASVPDAGAWSLPVVVKPRFGSAGIGVVIARTPAELAAATVSGRELIVQDVAPGDEYTLDVLADRSGRCRCVVPRKRLEVRAGEVSKAVTVQSEPLISLGETLCDALPGAYGALNVQVFVDGDEMRVIELNARFGGGYPLSHHAGADFSHAIVEELIGQPPSELTGWRADVTMLRYDDAVFVERSTGPR